MTGKTFSAALRPPAAGAGYPPGRRQSPAPPVPVAQLRARIKAKARHRLRIGAEVRTRIEPGKALRNG